MKYQGLNVELSYGPTKKTSSKIQFFSLAERPQALHSKGVTFIKLCQLELISLGKMSQ